MKNKILIVMLVLASFTTSTSFAQEKQTYEATKKKCCLKWEKLLDDDLSKWEVWTGIPDPSVKNLPATYKPSDGEKNTNAIGLGDPMGIYTVSKDEKGNPQVHISGEVYAGLTTLKDYSNYHLTMLFKWGEKKYAPRLDVLRDNGLLYHCYGDHGAFWGVWKRCLESQIQEGDFGDLFTLRGTQAQVRCDDENRWDPTSDKIEKRAKRGIDAESEHGEWTRIDLYVIGDKAIHVTNGVVALALEGALDHEGNSLTSGQIQIQSEGAEAFVKDICIRPIKKFPKKVVSQTAFNK